MMDVDKSKTCRSVRNRRGKAGETLAETLVAMLIIGLSSVLFATMVGAASRIFEKAKTGYDTICADVTAAEMQEENDKLTESIGQITVIGTDSATVTVTWYRNKDGDTDSVLSYK